MRELNTMEIENVSGGQISGYQGAGAVLAVLGAGAFFGTIGAPVLAVGIGVAAGLAVAQFAADVGC